MEINSPVKKLKLLLTDIKTLMTQVDLDAQVYKEGTTAGQIAFHASGTANSWLKVKLLGGEFNRDKESELTKPHTIEEINNALDSAIEACDQLGAKELDLNEKLSEEVTMGEWTIDTVGSALIFLTAHTSGHAAELTMLRDYVSTLK